MGNPINGTCDGKGRCANPWEDACGIYACIGKNCGDDCLSGVVEGQCDTNGHCNVANDNLDCEGMVILDLNLYFITLKCALYQEMFFILNIF